MPRRTRQAAAWWIGFESVGDLDGVSTYHQPLRLLNRETRMTTRKAETYPGHVKVQDGAWARRLEIGNTIVVDVDGAGRVLEIERLDGPVDYATLLTVLRTIRVEGGL